MKWGIDLGVVSLVGLCLALGLSGVGCAEKETASPEKAMPKSTAPFDPMALEISNAKIVQGRDIWMKTCAQCHIRGLGGAPIIGDKAAWASRIAQGNEVLYEHAINGFIGPQLNEMPAKGGFTDLTDDEVKLAVDFVVFASQ